MSRVTVKSDPRAFYCRICNKRWLSATGAVFYTWDGNAYGLVAVLQKPTMQLFKYCLLGCGLL